jgi:hypothetical protein
MIEEGELIATKYDDESIKRKSHMVFLLHKAGRNKQSSNTRRVIILVSWHL